ncbi:hypothetical protein FACS1894159_04760 [Bacteroidia bacterium]|nr:hypothetical protein FACS1894159_04760 [Bacteroidia bacterium]
MTVKLKQLPRQRPEALWGVVQSPFGAAIVAFTPREEIIWLSFDAFGQAQDELCAFWKGGALVRDDRRAGELAARIFADEGEFDLSVAGTPFQVKVWQALLEIPRGERISYSELAGRVGMPSAVRAVATAVGRNNISYLVPCHRVVRSDGSMGGFRWGVKVKEAILDSESR